MKWTLASVAVLVALAWLILNWYGADPSTQLVDASGKQLTAGSQRAPGDPADAEALFAPVRAQIEAGEQAAAKAALLRILEESEQDGEACILLCDVTRELEEAEESVDWGLKAVELLPDSAPAHLAYARSIGFRLQTQTKGLSGILGALKDIGLFKSECERVIELDPTDTEARMMLVFTNLAPVPIGKASRALEIAAEIVPHDPVLGKRLLAICHHANDETERAIELCQEGIAEFPEDGGFHAALADIYVDQERFEEADAAFEAARQGERGEAYYRSLYYQARMHIEHELEPERALELLDSFIAGEPDYGGLPGVAHAIWRRGRALQLLGRLAEARAAWEECLRRDPENEYALDSLEETAV